MKGNIINTNDYRDFIASLKTRVLEKAAQGIKASNITVTTPILSQTVRAGSLRSAGSPLGMLKG
jgi:hypothetical protein